MARALAHVTIVPMTPKKTPIKTARKAKAAPIAPPVLAPTPAPVKRKPKAKPQPAAKKRATAAKTPVTTPKRQVAKKAHASKVKKPAKAVLLVDEDATTADDGDLMGLTPREAKFIDLYLVCRNGGRAYIEAGFNTKPGASSVACASRLLASARVQPFLKTRTKAMLDRSADEQDRLLALFTDAAYADPRELSERLVGACRYCYGKFNRYQYTAGEWDQKITAHAEKQEKAAEEGKPVKLKAPDPKGGTGYDWRKEPNHDCPECFGIGEGRTVIKDTRNLSPAALAIYAGIKEGKDGIEVKTHDQMKARDTLAKIYRMYEDNASVTVNLDLESATERFGKRMDESRATAAETRARRQAKGMTGD